jgi:hypothetical protein
MLRMALGPRAGQDSFLVECTTVHEAFVLLFLFDPTMRFGDRSMAGLRNARTQWLLCQPANMSQQHIAQAVGARWACERIRFWCTCTCSRPPARSVLLIGEGCLIAQHSHRQWRCDSEIIIRSESATGHVSLHVRVEGRQGSQTLCMHELRYVIWEL